jgi:hypothetical protein
MDMHWSAPRNRRLGSFVRRPKSTEKPGRRFRAALQSALQQHSKVKRHAIFLGGLLDKRLTLPKKTFSLLL